MTMLLLLGRALILGSLLIFALGTNPTKTSAADTCQLTWQVIPSPNVGTGNNQLSGVAALAADDVWAVGYTFENGTSHSLMVHWDGLNWSVVPIPDVGAIYSGIEVIAPNDMWVGGDNPLHWNGTEWQVVSSPRPITHLSARNTNDIWATTLDARILHWDGEIWNDVPFPPQADNANLTDIQVLGEKDVWVIGHWYGQPRTYPILYRWTGANWSSVSVAPYDSIYPEGLGGSADNLWMVGYESTDAWAMADLWDGTQWVEVNTPELFPQYTGSGRMSFTEIQVKSAESIWAVGVAENWLTGRGNPLVEQWDGQRWRVHKTPLLEEATNVLTAIAVLADSDVWAVGYKKQDQNYQTLILHGTLPCVPWQRLEPKKPKLTSPSDGVTITKLPLKLEWKKVNNGLYYAFNLRHSGFTIKNKLLTKKQLRLKLQDEGNYRWRVLACNGYGCSQWSLERRFIYDK